jgi:hypothetical protein
MTLFAVEGAAGCGKTVRCKFARNSDPLRGGFRVQL